MGKSSINVLNRFFYRNTFRDLINDDDDHIYKTVIRKYVDSPNEKTNKELICLVYDELKNNYRNEYFYKNTLLNKLLLGVHSINTTTALTEIPIAKSKADFILINGKAVVYEIKTELDNFDRLKGQLSDYYKAFDHVAVVTCEENISKLKLVLDLPEYVGVYILQKNGRLRTLRKPERHRDELEALTLFKVLRKEEYENVIQGAYGQLPNVTPFKYYKTCQKLFIDISLDEAYDLSLKELKKRAVLREAAFGDVPYELKFLAYFMELKDNEYHRLQSFLESYFGGAY